MSVKDTATAIIKSINDGDTLTTVRIGADSFHADTVKIASVLLSKKLGGIYIDLDMEPNFEKDLFDLLKDRIILNKWYDSVRCKWELNNALMGIRPGDFTSLLEYSFDEYKSKLKMKIYNTWKIRFMLHTTGVRAFKRWAKKQKYDYTESIHEYITDEMSATWLTSFH